MSLQDHCVVGGNLSTLGWSKIRMRRPPTRRPGSARVGGGRNLLQPRVLVVRLEAWTTRVIESKFSVASLSCSPRCSASCVLEPVGSQDHCVVGVRGPNLQKIPKWAARAPSHSDRLQNHTRDTLGSFLSLFAIKHNGRTFFHPEIFVFRFFPLFYKGIP